MMGALMEGVSLGTILQGVAITILSASVLGVAKLWRDFSVSMAQRELLIRQNDGEHAALRRGQDEIKDSLGEVVDEIKGLRRDLTHVQITTGSAT